MLISEIENNDAKVDQILMVACLKYGVNLSELISDSKEIVERVKTGEYSKLFGKNQLLSKTKLLNSILENDKFWDAIGQSSAELEIINKAYDRLDHIETDILDLIDELSYYHEK